MHDGTSESAGPPEEFRSQSQAQGFGDHGKLIIDTEDNRYVIPNVEELPKSDRTKSRQHIYW
jgi:hypothetical protein